MTDAVDPLPAVRELLADAVDSLEKLEVSIHLYDARPRPQEVSAIARAVSRSNEDVTDALSELAREGLVRPVGENRWAFDRRGRRAASFDALAKLYRDDRAEVLRLMTELAIARVRGKAAERLAGALVDRLNMKKGKPDA